jgi:transcriptional regulator with XRE-family HTH domain
MTTQIAALPGRLQLLMSFEPEEIGRRIKAARERKGWTQLQFALEAGKSPSTTYRWEHGRLPPVHELVRIAGLLDVDVTELVEPEEKQDPNSVVLAELGEIKVMLRELLCDREGIRLVQ